MSKGEKPLLFFADILLTFVAVSVNFKIMMHRSEIMTFNNAGNFPGHWTGNDIFNISAFHTYQMMMVTGQGKLKTGFAVSKTGAINLACLRQDLQIPIYGAQTYLGVLYFYGLIYLLRRQMRLLPGQHIQNRLALFAVAYRSAVEVVCMNFLHIR